MHHARASRAQASGLIVFFLILGVSALVWALLNPPAELIFQFARDAAETQQAKDVIDQRSRIWSNVLFFVVIFGGVFLTARAVFQSRGPG